MQPASDLADGSSEGDSSAVAVEQPRGSRHGTATLPGCSDAAQPAALVQPDVCSLEDADTDLQARQGSYAEAEVSILVERGPWMQCCSAPSTSVCALCATYSCFAGPCLFCLELQLAGS